MESKHKFYIHSDHFIFYYYDFFQGKEPKAAMEIMEITQNIFLTHSCWSLIGY